MSLTNRQKAILKAIVESYIETAVPVGSRSLSKKYNFNISPATIRNEMSELEDEGYLYHPHTSAGRIPSDKGYRYFVDYLMKLKKLTTKESWKIKQILKEYKEKTQEVRKLVQAASYILSEITHHPCFSIFPQFNDSKVKDIQLLKISIRNYLVVLVLEEDIVETGQIKLVEELSHDELEEITKILRMALSGASLLNIEQTILNKLNLERNIYLKYEKVLISAIRFIKDILKMSSDEIVIMTGKLNLFQEPEFKDVEKMKKIIKYIESKESLLKLLTQEITLNQDITLLIGKEETKNKPEDLSLITKPINIRSVRGALGIIGPTRMYYSQSIAAILQVAIELESIIAEENI